MSNSPLTIEYTTVEPALPNGQTENEPARQHNAATSNSTAVMNKLEQKSAGAASIIKQLAETNSFYDLAATFVGVLGGEAMCYGAERAYDRLCGNRNTNAAPATRDEQNVRTERISFGTFVKIAAAVTLSTYVAGSCQGLFDKFILSGMRDWGEKNASLIKAAVVFFSHAVVKAIVYSIDKEATTGVKAILDKISSAISRLCHNREQQQTEEQQALLDDAQRDINREDVQLDINREDVQLDINREDVQLDINGEEAQLDINGEEEA